MVRLTPWFAPVEWASGLPCPHSCGHLPAERMPPGMAAWQAGGSLHKRAPTPALVFLPCLLVAPRRGRKPRRQGRKTARSCPDSCWKWSAFYAIAELLELLDHSGSARALDPLAAVK